MARAYSIALCCDKGRSGIYARSSAYNAGLLRGMRTTISPKQHVISVEILNHIRYICGFEMSSIDEAFDLKTVVLFPMVVKLICRAF